MKVLSEAPASLPDSPEADPRNESAGEFHLGAAQVAVLWRLTKSDVASRAIVMDDANGMRLVIVEDERIVQWERFTMASQLRIRAGALQHERRRNGWY
jgi:hypothetical protein